jgi:dTDP-4-amino-4,6-dideoxygalactose transaminase
MYLIGDEEVEAIRKLFRSGEVFRYGQAGECDRFEERFGELLGVNYVRMCNSGTSGLIAALIGMGIGPGDDVIVPAYTYMASPMAVLAVGAIPIVADVDESLTLDPEDTASKITDRTAAIMPVHMVGLSCDMDSLCELARQEDVRICEDVCQAVGGGYQGRKLGSFGHASGFSFNYFKNITAGEGGCFVTDDENVFERGSVAIDPCSYYWAEEGEKTDMHGHFTAWNFRATEIAGAILNVQLDRLEGMLAKMRHQKKVLTAAGEQCGLRPIVCHSPDYECGSHAGFIFEEEEQAVAFSEGLGEKDIKCFRPIDTGRHVYTAWDPVMKKQAAHHPALNPYLLEENQDAEADYTPGMCSRSLDILRRSALIGTHPSWTDSRLDEVADAVRDIAK